MCAVVFALVGCDEATGADGACTPGEVVVCACPDGDGASLCLGDGQTTECACDSALRTSPSGCGSPGARRACRCDDGRPGDRACRSDGTLSPCACALVPQVGDARSDAGAEPPTTSPPPTVAPSERCCHELGSCLPQELIPSAERALFGREQCSDVELACVPDLYALAADALVLQPCRSLGSVEGRCLLDCLPSVAEQADTLPRDLCDAHELCAPCFDPFTGRSTGACTLGDDEGPREDAVLFGRCCDDAGQCVPRTVLSASGAEALPLDSCDDERRLLCVPDAVAAGLSVCTAFARAEGRCIPTCMLAGVDTAAFAQESCASGELCTPCADPVSGAATGACSIGDDPGPASEPFVFASCCVTGDTALGRCVPSALVPASASSLPALECQAAGDICVPDILLTSEDHALRPCRGRLGGAGACLPECMIDSSLATLLGNDVCAEGELCVPCSIAGQATGVCSEP